MPATAVRYTYGAVTAGVKRLNNDGMKPKKIGRQRRKLLLELERIVELNSEWGYVFRYPLRVLEDGKFRTCRKIPDDISDEQLFWVHYKFGNNSLYIFELLNDVLNHLAKKVKRRGKARRPQSEAHGRAPD